MFFDMKWTPENIRSLRKRLGMTQQELGDFLGYSQPQIRISELERGERNPSGAVQRLLDMLAEKYEYEPDEGDG